MTKITLAPATKLTFASSLTILVIWIIVFVILPISSYVGVLVFLLIVVLCIGNIPKSGRQNQPNHVVTTRTKVILYVASIILLIVVMNIKSTISTLIIKNDLYSTMSNLDLPKTLKLQSDLFQHTPGDIDTSQISSYTFTYSTSEDIPMVTQQFAQSLKSQGYNIILSTQYTDSHGDSMQVPTGAYKDKGRIVLNFYRGNSPNTFQIVALWNYNYQQPQYVGQ